MAMGFFNHLAGGGAVVWSGGSEPKGEINPAAITAMAERGIDISGKYPKPWTGEIIQAADVIVSMGCGDTGPTLPGRRYEDWALDDPAAKTGRAASATRSNAACAGYSTTCEFPTGPDPHRARDQFVQDDVLVFGLVVIVALFATVIVGTVLGRRYRVGPPVLLILLGALLGLIPQFGGVRLDGEIVLLLFLPAILYWEGLNTSFREIREEPARHRFPQRRPGDCHCRSGDLDGTGAGNGVTRGVGPRCRALPHRRRRRGRPGETATASHSDRVEGGKHHQRRDRARPLRRERLRCGRRKPDQPDRPDGPFRRLLPRWYLRRAAGRSGGDPGAPPNRRTAGGGSPEPADAIRRVLARPIDSLQRRRRCSGVGPGDGVRLAVRDPGSFPPPDIRVLGSRDISDQRLAMGVRRRANAPRGARYCRRRRRNSPRRFTGSGRHRRHPRDSVCLY